jgi:hypothetical protein
MDMEEVANWLAAICACGYWTCFHEFNSVNPNILSSLAKMFSQIHDNKELIVESESKSLLVDFNGQEVPFDWECGIFMTLNPNERGVSRMT